MSATGLPFTLWPLDAIALILFGLTWGGYLHQPNAPLEANEILPCVAVPTEPLMVDA